jgi:hypothetical protein
MTFWSAILMALTVALHVIGGGNDVHEPLQSALRTQGSAPELIAIAAVIWHLVTVAIAGLAYGLWVLARRNDAQLEILISGIQLGFTAVFIAYGIVRLGTPWAMPQWVLFIVSPILTRLGQSRRKFTADS